MPGAEKILVRGVNWLGDAVMTTPALQRLREAKPSARITLLTHEKLADLWKEHPSLDATIQFRAGESVFSVGRRLRSERFDSAVVFPNSPRSALEVFLAGIPKRTGYARNWRSVFLTKALPPRKGAIPMRKRSVSEINARIAQNLPRETFPPASHHVHDYLHIVKALGANSTPLPPLISMSEREVAEVRARFNLANGKVLFALNPGAEYGPAKRWPLERFVDAAIQLYRATECRWLIFGGRGDLDLANNITAQITRAIGVANVMNLAGQTSLRELCAVLKASSLLLTNDTGPMHLAAALGTPLIVPFGSTSPEMTTPDFTTGQPEFITGQAPCAPCFLRECPIDFRCMKSISVQQVVDAALRTWQRISP